MSAQRARSGVAADRRSIHPNIPGVPWWAAVVIAVTATAVGFAYDAGSGNKELTIVFAALYVVGCVAAVLAVRQSGVFTAVTQPPLILFCAVPGAYWLFHGAKIAGAKDILINCGYPLIERFPLMLFTSAAVLLLGMVRWYAGTAARAKTQPDDASGARRGWLAAKFAALGSRNTADGAEKTGTSRRVHPVARTKSAKPASGARPAKRPAPTRSRHARPPLDEQPESAVERTRRRRPYPPRDPDLRSQPPREIRRDPHTRTGRPASRSGRFDPYEPMEPYEPQRRRAASNAANGAAATHHPISRVRYRGAARSDQADADRRTRSRGPYQSAAESWEYDI
ncbi:DUF6542 domain-containing protein [Mycobacterium xenopi]|uniref:DUF6542 domain-containing protein n=1 Tax=Mycobacterium xenopi TaxID=1789 RepID=UPI000A14E3CF|nr:DUF6542 domain-containing protein [Mycobacterium xenopi]MDA3659099.1 hypothetical protein [Mycobacterium xenopi]ORX21214.1 hypothetical protein AWC32_01635 [Mycobacterium xenopi]